MTRIIHLQNQLQQEKDKFIRYRDAINESCDRMKEIMRSRREEACVIV